eukprot:2807-Chlamydomonas_euryale.AAC.1
MTTLVVSGAVDNKSLHFDDGLRLVRLHARIQHALVRGSTVEAKLDALKEAQDTLAQKQDKLAQKIEEDMNLVSNKIDKLDNTMSDKMDMLFRNFVTQTVWLAAVVAAWAGLLPNEAFKNSVLSALLGKGPL